MAQAAKTELELAEKEGSLIDRRQAAAGAAALRTMLVDQSKQPMPIKDEANE